MLWLIDSMKFFKKNIFVLLLILFSILALVDLLHPGFPLTHDGQDHIARIANFYTSLKEGNFVPRWAGNLNWGYGHPILMFLYPLPSYIASVFILLGVSFVDSFKLVFALSFLASVLAMYYWLREEFGDLPAFTGAVLYGFSPYRFVDLYVRGAIGEHLAFVFFPLLCLGTLRLSRKDDTRGWVIVALSTGALILSHNALSLMFFPLAILYALYLYWKENLGKKFIVKASSAFAIGFLLSAFFWVPAFFEGKYTLRDLVTRGVTENRFVEPFQFIYSPWSYGGSDTLSKMLGFPQLLAGVFVLFFLYRSKDKIFKIFSGSLIVLALISLFFMTSTSRFFWENISVLQKFQFPWRLLSVTVCVFSVIGATAVAVVEKKKQFFVSMVLVGLTLISTFPMWRAREYLEKKSEFFSTTYDSTTDTGESSPIWSIRFMEKRPDRDRVIEIIGGEATIQPTIRTSTRHEYDVVAVNTAQLRENTVYFPGWHVFVNGKETLVEYQDQSNRGVMTFYVPPGNSHVSVVFTDTKIRQASVFITLIGVLIFLSTVIFRKKIWKT